MLSFFQPSFTPFERRVFGDDDFFAPHFQTRRHFHTRPASYRRRPVDPFASFNNMIDQALMDTLAFTAPAAPIIVTRPSPPPVVTVKVVTQKPRRQLKRKVSVPQHPKKSSSAPTILPSPSDPPKAIESAETIPVQQNEQVPQPVVNNQQVVPSSPSPSSAPQANPLDLLSVPSMFRPFFSSPFWSTTNDDDELDQLWQSHRGITLERKENDMEHEWLAKTPVDLPAGWTPENLEVSLENGGRFLSVRGSLTTSQESPDGQKKPRALRSSRRFARQIRLPEGVDPETAQARLTKDEKTGQTWVEISMRPQTPPSTSSPSSSSSVSLTVEQKNESKIIPVQYISSDSSSSSSSSSSVAPVESDSSSSSSVVENEVKEADSTPPEESPACSSSPSCDSCSSSSSCGVCDVQEDGGCCSSAPVEQKEDVEMEPSSASVHADLEMDLKVETEDVEVQSSNNNDDSNNNDSIAQESQEETEVTPGGPAEVEEEEKKAAEAEESTTQVTPADAVQEEEELELPMPDEE